MSTSVDLQSYFSDPIKKNFEKFLKGFCSKISPEEALSMDMNLIDVRTSEEFERGSIPTAKNFPIFDNLERSEIGTIYRYLGRDHAVKKGLEFFEPKLQQFLFSLASKKYKHLVVYCGRGGMRSASVVRLLHENGFLVSQMCGGYKEYRKFVIKQLMKNVPPLIVLHGKTGVGKTLILKKLPSHLDLEDLAQHRIIGTQVMKVGINRRRLRSNSNRRGLRRHSGRYHRRRECSKTNMAKFVH